MLTSIGCPRFRVQVIRFGGGLNVILGDNAGSNSIGKSTLLMVIDYAFGGTDLVNKMPDVVGALGHHHYDLTFQFSTGPARFRRTTDTPTRVHRCGGSFNEIVGELTLEEFTAWLAEQYQIDQREISLRSCVSPFIRVWRRETLDVTHPLTAALRESSTAVLDRFLGIMSRYAEIKNLSEEHQKARAKFSSLDAAIRFEIVPRVAYTQYRQNEQKLKVIERQIEELRANLAGFAVSINDVLSKEATELSVGKEALLRERGLQTARLARYKNSLDGALPIPTRELQELRELVPSINMDRLRTIEDFHRGITSILKEELSAAVRKTEAQLQAIDAEVAAINTRLQASVARLSAPPDVIDRLLKLVNEQHRLQTENDYYDRRKSQKQTADELKEKLESTRRAAIETCVIQVNRKMAVIADRIFSGEVKHPVLSVNKASYALSFPTDKGTGTAYTGLLVFDLALLELSRLPLVVEDSLLFSNIQPASMQQLVVIYASASKQVFIAIDKVDSLYGETAKILQEKAVITLSRAAPLYDKDWRTGPV